MFILWIICAASFMSLSRPFNAVFHLKAGEVNRKRTFPSKHYRDLPPSPQSCQRRGRLCERITRVSTSLASYASLLFWRPPVSGLIEMFSQSQASELSIETVLEIIESILGRPLAPCQTNKQKEGEVGNKSRRLSSVNTGCLERKAWFSLAGWVDFRFLQARLRFITSTD